MDIRKLRVRQLMLIIVDILSIIFSLYGSLILRFEGLLEQTYKWFRIVCNTPDESSFNRNWQRPQISSLLHLTLNFPPILHSLHSLHCFAFSETIDSQCWSFPHVSVTMCSVESQSSCKVSTIPTTRQDYNSTFRKSVNTGPWIT